MEYILLAAFFVTGAFVGLIIGVAVMSNKNEKGSHTRYESVAEENETRAFDLPPARAFNPAPTQDYSTYFTHDTDPGIIDTNTFPRISPSQAVLPPHMTRFSLDNDPLGINDILRKQEETPFFDRVLAEHLQHNALQNHLDHTEVMQTIDQAPIPTIEEEELAAFDPIESALRMR